MEIQELLKTICTLNDVNEIDEDALNKTNVGYNLDLVFYSLVIGSSLFSLDCSIQIVCVPNKHIIMRKNAIYSQIMKASVNVLVNLSGLFYTPAVLKFSNKVVVNEDFVWGLDKALSILLFC